MPAIARSEPFRGQGPCPLGVCDGSGWILDDESDEARSCECRETRLRRGRNRGLASVIPRKFQGVSFDRPPVPQLPVEAVRSTKRYIENLDQNLAAGKGIWFLGDIGTGKTTLAMLISKTALEKGHSVAIYSMPVLLNRIRSTYRAEGAEDTYSKFFEKLTSVDLLHIDDLGAEKQTEWVIEQLYSIVNERYEAERAVMFTANSHQIDQDDSDSRRERDRRGEKSELIVEKQIGRRTFSRLAEMCGDPVLLLGDDHRSSGHELAPVIDIAP
jgi:DNA replication protein DnaC